MKLNKKIGIVLAIVIPVAGVAAFAVSEGEGSDDDEVATVPVERGDIVATALAIGTLEPDVEVGVKSKVSGVIRKRFADEGDYVEEGAPLLEIRPDPTPLELVEARRQVELGEIELANLEKALERQRELAAREVATEREYEDAELAYRQAELQVRSARQRLALLEDGRVTGGGQTVESVVRSPISGFILESMVEIGDPVAPLSSYQEGTVLLTMADMERLVFRGTVDEIDVGRLEEGMPAELKIGALPDALVQGIVSRISLKARVEENSRVFPIEIVLTDPGDAVLRAGYSANARIVIDEKRDVMTLPERVVHFADDSAWVELHLAPDASERRRIETGLSDAITVEVLSGLEDGEQVREKEIREIE